MEKKIMPYLRRSRGRGECVSNVCRIFVYLSNKKAMYGIF
jgi:hypothetical protein